MAKKGSEAKYKERHLDKRGDLLGVVTKHRLALWVDMIFCVVIRRVTSMVGYELLVFRNARINENTTQGRLFER